MTTLKKYIDILISKINKVPTMVKLFVIFLITLIPTAIFWIRILSVIETFREVQEFFDIELPVSKLVMNSMMAIMTTLITAVIFFAFIKEVLLKKEDTTNNGQFHNSMNQRKELENLEIIQQKRKRLMESMKKIEEGEDLDSEDLDFLEGLEKEFKDEPDITEEPVDIDIQKIDSEIERLRNLTNLEQGISRMRVPTKPKKPLEFLKNLKIFQRQKHQKQKKDFNPRAMPL